MKRAPFVEIDGTPYIEWWNERFAPAADIFRGKRFYQRGKANIWVGTADISGLSATRMDAVGVHLLRVGRRMWKPTSAAIVLFGATATTNRIDLDRGELAAFIAGRDVSVSARDLRRGAVSPGFLVACYEGVGVGCGEWREERVVSLLPRSQRLENLDV